MHIFGLVGELCVVCVECCVCECCESFRLGASECMSSVACFVWFLQ